MDEPTVAKSGTGKTIKLGWILAVVFAVFVFWVIYTSIQPQVVETDVSTTEMPDDMPGMDH